MKFNPILLSLLIASCYCASSLSGDEKFECNIDADCNSDYYSCEADSSGQGYCEHKSLFPMIIPEFIGCFVIVVMEVVAHAAGTAGGGVVIPLIMAFFAENTKVAIAMSNASVIFAAFMRYCWIFKQRDPKKGVGVLIDYNYTTVMIPMIEIGATLGVFINIMLPEVIIVTLLTLVLGFVSVTSLVKFIRIRRRETVELRQQQEGKPAETELQVLESTEAKKEERRVHGPLQQQTSLNQLKVIIDEGEVQSPDPNREASSIEESADSKNLKEAQRLEKLNELIKREDTHFQWKKIVLNWVMILSLLVISVLRGDGTGDMTGVEKCQPLDWFLFALLLGISVVLTVVALVILRKEYQEKIEAGWEFSNSDLKITFKHISQLLIFSFLAALASAGLGVGLGLVLAPVMLQQGLEPLKSASTEVYMAFYGTLASTILVLIFGGLPHDYTVVLIAMALIGAGPGIYLQNYLISRTGRQSYIVFFLFFCILFCFVMIPVLAFPNIVDKHNHGFEIMSTSRYCPEY